MPVRWRLCSKVGVGSVHMVGGKGRHVLCTCSVVLCNALSVLRVGREGMAGVLQTRYISTPHIKPKRVRVGMHLRLFEGRSVVLFAGRW
jgi:hypothetical protein